MAACCLFWPSPPGVTGIGRAGRGGFAGGLGGDGRSGSVVDIANIPLPVARYQHKRVATEIQLQKRQLLLLSNLSLAACNDTGKQRSPLISAS